MTAETNTTDHRVLIGKVSASIAVIDRYTKILQLQEGRDDFNIFDIIRIAGKEQCHSDIIAEILNPDGRHGLSTAGLRHFIDMLIDLLKGAAGEASPIKNADILQNWQCDGTRVDREHGGPSGRVDILLMDGSDGPNKRTIVIENKIWSGEGHEQLKRYRDDYPKALLVFLTLDGREAVSAYDENDYLSLSYQEDVKSWIQKCEKEAARYPALRESLIQYRKTIQSLTGRRINVMSNVMKEELGNIITANKESLRAAFEIRESDIFGILLEKNVIPTLKEYAKKRGLLFDKNDGNWGKRYDGFSFRSTEWRECRIRFDFQGTERRSLVYGFWCNLNETTAQKEIKDAFLKIKDGLSQPSSGSAWEHTEWWPLYRDMDEEFRHWNAEHTDRWIDLYDPTTSKTLQRVADALDELLGIVDKHNIAL